MIEGLLGSPEARAAGEGFDCGAKAEAPMCTQSEERGGW